MAAADTGQDENPSTRWTNFNPSFLAFIIVCGLLSIFFLNYFNRVFASAVSYLIRLYTWHKHKIWVDIQALQVSLLAGRIFFTGFRYHGNNETILIQNGYITWSYWLWRVRDVDLALPKPEHDAANKDTENPAEPKDKSSKLPCRINIAISGLEWFIYNRTPVYDSLLAGMTDAVNLDEQHADDSDKGHNHPRQRLQKASQKVEEQLNKLDSKVSADKRRSETSDEEKLSADAHRLASALANQDDGASTGDSEMPLMLQLLPIHFECDKGAVVMGNENTKSILIIKTKSFSGEIDASGCETPDPYRQTFKIRLEHPVVEMKENEKYQEDQLTRAVKDKQAVLGTGPGRYRPFFRRHRRRVLGKLRDMVPYWRSSVESFSVHSRHGTTHAENQLPGSNHWQGLSRYLNDDEENDKLRWSSIEYAAVSTVIDSPEAVLTIFWDVPGKVVKGPSSMLEAGHERDNINGAAPPAWAINLTLGGGVINYGPWADRHRAELQRVFNPSLSKDGKAATRLQIGADRIPTQFKLYVEIDKEVTLRIPTREDSKNWKWKKTAADLQQHQKQEQGRGKKDNKEKSASAAAQQRPYGWLDIKVAANATISYSMDMLASSSGYHNTLNVNLPSTEISTSVNHGTLWKSGAQRISCDMSNPLKWNSLRKWTFDVAGDDLELFILRDHIFLLVDLIDDWGSGPPQDYLLFVPFKYFLNIQFRNLKLYLNVNDVNIVNNPTEMEDNTYLVLSSPLLKADTCISLDSYRPSKNAVPFNIQADMLDLALHLPTWNTQATFLTSKDVGHLENLALDGKYHYNTTTSPANTDTLVLNASGQSLVVTLHGFIIRYFLQLKDNYFGDHVHFKTLDEYQELLRLKTTNPDAEAATRPPHKKSNDLDVVLGIRCDDPKVLLPANLYSAKRHVTIEGAGLAADLRFTNYYMDLDLNLSPLSLALGNDEDGAVSPTSTTSSTQMYIDGLSIYGSRLFGLPPTEPTYMCNWDLSIGAITGECTTEFLTVLANGGKAFGFCLDDDENALIPYSSVVMYDVTFLRVFVHSIQLWLHVDDAAFLLSTDHIDVNYNDWARSHYSKRANVQVPSLQIACVNSESAARHKSRLHSDVETDGVLKTSITFGMIGRKSDFTEARKLQQALVRREDQRTRRTEFLLLPQFLDSNIPDAVDEPAQSVPSIPQPVVLNDEHAEKETLSSLGSIRHAQRSLNRKSSFLSFSTMSDKGMTRPGSINVLQPTTDMGRKASNSGQHTRSTQPLFQDYSASTGRRSPLKDKPAGHFDRKDMAHNMVAFSSQFVAPYFPLENVRPETREAAFQSIEQEAEEAPDPTPFGLEDIDPEHLGEGKAYSSFLVELPIGVTAFLNPTSLKHIAALIGALQPTEPDDILDGLQIESMSDIFDAQKQKSLDGSIKDFVVRIPQANLRFLNCSDLDSPVPSQDAQDQYDFSITKLALAARTEALSSQLRMNNEKARSSFHLRLESAEVSAAERFASLNETHAAVKANIERVSVSMASKDVTYIDGDVGSFRTTSSSDKIGYLAALIHRSSTLGSETASMFSDVSSIGDQRIKYLVYRLMVESNKVGDPSFIVRPSAILRAANEHLRTYDSWKLASRLRQLWTASNIKTREQLRLDCLASNLTYPDDARQKVTAAFQKWRNWDLDNINGSELMNNTFGKVVSAAQLMLDRAPMMAVLRLQEGAFVLDPGPKQNQIYVVDITTRLVSKSTKLDETQKATGSAQGLLTIVNTYCAQAGVNLNWELVELAEDILRLYIKSDTQTKMQSTAPVDRPSSQPGKPKQLSSTHVVFGLGQGSIFLETVNLKSDVQSNGMKISVLMANRDGFTDNNAILACDTVTTKLRSHQQHLGTLRLHGPSVFVSHDLQLANFTSVHTIKATASSEDLRLVVKQDPTMLSEVLDTVVRDELAQLYQIKQQLPTTPESAPQKSKISERLSSVHVNLAMFLKSYTITIPLLRSLTYTIQGVVARAAMAANFGKEIIFDFDIKENSHNMQIRVNNELRSISVLQIPPTNGRITSQMGQEDHSVTVFASVELIQLDASAVYSLLSALNRPEVSNAINDLQQQGKVLRQHIGEVFGDTPTAPDVPLMTSPKSEAKRLVYVVHATLAGIEIFGHAPIKSDNEPMAHLSFCLASVHFEVANRLDSRGPVLENPEIHVNLRRILFDVQKGGSEETMRTCGNVSFGALVTATTRELEDGTDRRSFEFRSDGLQVNLSADTVSTFVDVLGYMGDKIKDLDSMREIEYLQKRLRQSRPRITINDQEDNEDSSDIFDSFLASIFYSFEITNIQFCWLVTPTSEPVGGEEDLVLSFQRIEFATRKKNTAKLTIENFQLQMVPPDQDKMQQSHNSALLPEVIFNVAFVSTLDTRRLAFQAVGKSLDLRLTSGFIVPAAHLADSIGLSIKNARQASANWTSIVVTEKPAVKPHEKRQRTIFGGKRLESCLVDADFAGAVVNLSNRKHKGADGPLLSRAHRSSMAGKYGQFTADDSGSSTVLRSPGLAWKIEYRDDGKEDSAIYGEIKVDASRNILYPTVVPLVMDITSSIKEVVSDHGKEPASPSSVVSKTGHASKPKLPEEDSILTADPSAVLGRTKLNLGLRICKQEFTLSCQPIARVAATACFDDIYITVNTVHSVDHGNFFAISGTFTNLQMSVQHVYSREHTGRFEVDSVVLSLMNSKHVSGTSGVSAILKVSPMKVDINAKQLQDFLLFREIWVPRGVRQATAAPVSTPSPDATQSHLVQRYQQVAATAAFPWTATISIAALNVKVDLGQSIGKSTFDISDFWMSSKKTSDWEQNLCLGFENIGVDCDGRLSGFVALQDFRLRTSIEWPEREAALNETPRVQASVSFSQFRLKAAFDYQVFLVADITSMDFLMYNVRRRREGNADRLVAVFDGEAVQIFGIATSAASGIALWQALQKLIQERKSQFENSLRDIEKFMKRKSLATQPTLVQTSSTKSTNEIAVSKSPISLDTDVVVTLKALNLGIFPGTFSDKRIFKLEALNAQARFAASMQHRRIHSILGLTLGQLRIGLAEVRRVSAPKSISELTVEDVVASATGSRGGTILKVPKVEAIMQTWQLPESRSIDYIFKSAFEGKVEVGWNYARIGYIRNMWATHSKTLARTLGRELPEVSAIKVTGVPEPSTSEDGKAADKKGQTKITAEVNVPQSKYEYVALEPPIIETPQLRDMGEATPPLEWIGLHRERLPNLTHQIVIVTLLELAGEVEDAYERILGSS
ncbi:fermentation associated protein [Truncatella angustata]|uniref:Fermentation associated protein n=1 Tax=Truncatella angustata TaxID=152316 RepID=A0A9P8UXN7_9PEZI|nr:fermentation associated protein [Truncatella angustata]KAH6659834.1 fermentation associated protein [Truncatella angustata]